MAERFIGWFCLDMPATLENLFSCRRVEPFATGETRRMAGYCTYLGAPEKRAASSLISFEMVRAYEKLSNIKIEHQGREATYISPEKRNEIVASLFAVSKNPKPLKWSQLREKLDMQSSDSFDSRHYVEL